MSSLTQIQFFKSSDGNISFEVPVQDDSVWLTQDQLILLFERDKSTVSRHLKNIFLEGELTESQVVAKFATTASDGKTYQVTHYNLDVIISVGYRVKSKKGVLFRQWANRVLKHYLLEGYAINESRVSKLGVEKLQQAIDLLSQTLKNNKTLHRATIDNVIYIIQQYSKAWDILLKYDEDRLDLPEMDGTDMKKISISEVRASIASFKHELCKVNQATDLFGQEKDNQLDAIVAALDQTFDGLFLYKSIEERAANLLYLVIKDHPFLDGNKRIGSFLFTSYLSQSGKKSLSPQSLVALALLIAESNPKQKDLMIQLIINLIVKF